LFFFNGFLENFLGKSWFSWEKSHGIHMDLIHSGNPSISTMTQRNDGIRLTGAFYVGLLDGLLGVAGMIITTKWGPQDS
jgi:hypothetical protein